MKKIIFNKRQVTEVVGADFSYLSKDNDDFNEYIGDTEIVTTSQISGEENGDPLTTDKYAKELAPRFFYGHRDVRGTLSCSKKNKKSIVESNKDLENKTFKIPDELFSYLKNLLVKYQKQKNEKGYKRLTNLVNDRNITSTEMYRLKNFFNSSNNKDIEYNIIGGDKLKNWVNRELNSATDISFRNKDIKRNMGDTNAFIKSHDKEYGNDGAHSTISQKTEKNVKFSYE